MRPAGSEMLEACHADRSSMPRGMCSSQKLIERPKKGFGIPLARWLRGPLRGRMEMLIESSPVWDSGLVSRQVFRGWNIEHQTKRKDHSKALWALFVLDHWFRRKQTEPRSSGPIQ